MGALGQKFNKDVKKVFFKNTSKEILSEAQALEGLMQFLNNTKERRKVINNNTMNTKTLKF